MYTLNYLLKCELLRAASEFKEYFILKYKIFFFSFSSGLVLLKNIDDKKFSRLVDRMMKDFEPNKVSFFTEHELTSMEKSLKLNTDQCQCLLNCLHCLLKEVKYYCQ